MKSCRNLRQGRARGRSPCKARAWHAGSLLYRVWRKNRARSLAKNANAVRCAGQKLLHTHPQLSSMKSVRLSTSRGWPGTTVPGPSVEQTCSASPIGARPKSRMVCRSPAAVQLASAVQPVAATWRKKMSGLGFAPVFHCSEKSPGGRQAKGRDTAETAAAEVGAWREAGTGYPPYPPPTPPHPPHPPPTPPHPPPPQFSPAFLGWKGEKKRVFTLSVTETIQHAPQGRRITPIALHHSSFHFVFHPRLLSY